MSVIESQLDAGSPQYGVNSEHMRGLVTDLEEKLAVARIGGSEKARSRHLKRGKLLTRERIAALLDAGSPFLELSPMAAQDLYDGVAPWCRDCHGHWPDSWPGRDGRSQRSHG